MPKKSAAVDLTTPESIALLERYRKIGLNASRSKDVAQSAKASSAFQRLAEENDLDHAGLDEKQAGLCVDLTKEVGYENAPGKEKLSVPEVRYVVNAIKDGKLKTADQVKGKFVMESLEFGLTLCIRVVQLLLSIWKPRKIREPYREMTLA
jgi:hypothetical protein